MARRQIGGTHVALGLAVLLFLAAMLFSLARLEAQREADMRVDRLGLWFTTQAEVQLARFQVALERYVAGGRGVDRDQLFEGFEILWSRLPLLAAGGRADDDYEAARRPGPLVDELEARFAAIEQDVATLVPGDMAAYGRISDTLEWVRQQLADLNQAIHDQRLAAEMEKAQHLVALYRGFLLAALAMLASGGTLIWLLMRETRRTRQLLRMADEARAAASELSRDLQAVIDAVPAMITAFDPGGRYALMNRFHAEFFGVQPERVRGRTPSELGLDAALEAEVREVAATGRALPFFEQVVGDRQGRPRTLLTTNVPIVDGGGAVARVVHVSLDISERKAAEERVRHLAHHDPLTDLPNRAFLTEVLERALARAARHGRAVALLLVDLDRFKEINDTLGHPVGDVLLVEVARRALRCLRRGDTLARMGGDEFALLLEDIASPEDATSAAQRILDELADPFRLGNHTVVTGASIGIAIAPHDGTEVAELVRHADLALYRAKAEGRNRARLFDPAMNDQLRERLALEQALREAIEGEAFELHYQPLQRLGDGQVVGVEALLRWRHPTRGMIPPDQFIPLAEDTGLIAPLSDWVLRTACRQARHWHEAGHGPLRVSINISAELLGRQDLVAAVRTALAETGAEPRWLELELTESMLVRDAEQAQRVLGELRALGVALTLDDFGTGYSSLAYLQRFPLDGLKIDRGFIAELERHGSALRIVEAIIRLAHGLHLRVVAEGVETAAQLAILRRVGCDEIQGYLLSPPVEAGRLAPLLRALAAAAASWSATALQQASA
jgi:diguanylate cyclase (GGDEF)-like protein/PAS domain S-box-containing protein